MFEYSLAALAAVGNGELVGPLKGQHHDSYATRLPRDSVFFSDTIKWVKLRDPRPVPLWFDRRVLPEDALIRELHEQNVARIPVIMDSPVVTLHHFIEGRTLGDLRMTDAYHRVDAKHVRQIVSLVEQLAAIRPDRAAHLVTDRELLALAKDRDTGGFLDWLVGFTEENVYEPLLRDHPQLCAALGIRDVPPSALLPPGSRLTSRPFCLLHGDLHSENFIIDLDDDLWTIDWELALPGDPLYELATHLHLMHYGPEEEAVKRLWRTRVEAALPGSMAAFDRDLVVYRAYKAVQSVYTDVVRHVHALSAPDPQGRPTDVRLKDAGNHIHPVLQQAHALVPGFLSAAPTPQRVADAFGAHLPVLCGT